MQRVTNSASSRLKRGRQFRAGDHAGPRLSQTGQHKRVARGDMVDAGQGRSAVVAGIVVDQPPGTAPAGQNRAVQAKRGDHGSGVGGEILISGIARRIVGHSAA